MSRSGLGSDCESFHELPGPPRGPGFGMTRVSLACVRPPPQGGPIRCSPPHAPLEGSFHLWPRGSLDTPPRGLSHAPPLGGCCVTVHDPSPAHARGSCHSCQGDSPTLGAFPPYSSALPLCPPLTRARRVMSAATPPAPDLPVKEPLPEMDIDGTAAGTPPMAPQSALPPVTGGAVGSTPPAAPPLVPRDIPLGRRSLFVQVWIISSHHGSPVLQVMVPGATCSLCRSTTRYL